MAAISLPSGITIPDFLHGCNMETADFLQQDTAFVMWEPRAPLRSIGARQRGEKPRRARGRVRALLSGLQASRRAGGTSGVPAGAGASWYQAEDDHTAKAVKA
jgi:hypothetical protein